MVQLPDTCVYYNKFVYCCYFLSYLRLLMLLLMLLSILPLMLLSMLPLTLLLMFPSMFLLMSLYMANKSHGHSYFWNSCYLYLYPYQNLCLPFPQPKDVHSRCRYMAKSLAEYLKSFPDPKTCNHSRRLHHKSEHRLYWGRLHTDWYCSPKKKLYHFLQLLRFLHHKPTLSYLSLIQNDWMGLDSTASKGSIHSRQSDYPDPQRCSLL